MEYPAGNDQKLVVYVSSDDGGPVDFDEIMLAFSEEAARLERDGWQIVSTSVLPMRQTGTAGNMFFQSGGQFATKAGFAVVFGRR